MRWPLSNQIAVPLLLLLVGTLVVTTSINVGLAAARTRASIDRQIRGVVETLNASRFPLTDNVLEQMSGLTGAEFAVSAADQQLVAASLELPDASQTMRAKAPATVQGAPTTRLHGDAYYHLILPLQRQRTGDAPAQRLHVFYPQEDYRKAWRDAIGPPALVGGMASVIGIVFAFQIASRVTRSINTFRDGVDSLVRGEFHPLPVPPRNDEIRDLVRATNQLAETLSQYESEIRTHERLRTLGQLGAGMAHQLRNAVTGCQLALDLHAQDCSLAADESFRVAEQQLRLMNEYLHRFLSWGRGSSAAPTDFDLVAMIAEAVSLTRPLAEHAHVRLEWSAPPLTSQLHGDRHGLCQMLINVILNGIEAAARHAATSTPSAADRDARPHAAPQVLITLQSSAENAESASNPGDKVEAGSGRARIEVCDSGRGPSDKIATRLFEPLVTDKPEGTGMGLSVAREAVEAHGGQLGWERRDDWTCFWIELPGRAKRRRMVKD